MQPSPEVMTQRLSALRQSFDESFALPQRSQSRAGQVLLAIRAGGMQLAVHLSEVGSIHPVRKIVSLPDSAPGLLGIAGLRGRLLAVYDLAAMLGSQSAQKDCRLLLLAGADPHVALAVETLEAYVQVAEGEFHPAREGGTKHECIHELVEISGVARAVVSIPRIIEAVDGAHKNC